MDVSMNQQNKTNFKSKVSIVNNTKHKDVPLRQIVNYAKHHVGSNKLDVNICIDYAYGGGSAASNIPRKPLKGKYEVTIDQIYRPKKPVNHVNSYSRTYSALVNKGEGADNISEFTEDGMVDSQMKFLSKTKNWFQSIRAQEKKEMKTQQLPQVQQSTKGSSSKSLYQKIISFILPEN